MDAVSPKRQRAALDVFRYRNYREFLAAFYALKKGSGLSYRGFAKAAGVGAPNYLKLVVEGKRNLSESMAERFAKACRLNPEATGYFKLLVQFNQAKTDAVRNDLHTRLSEFPRFRAAQSLDLAQKEYHSTWYHPAIRELVACADFVEETAVLAAALRPAISEKQVSRALEALLKLGMLERDSTGRLRQAARAVTTGEQASGLYIRNYHAEMMQRATEAMQSVPAKERFISSLTLSTSQATLDEIQRRVDQLREELIALSDADPAPDRVVQLNVQLFPLSHAFEAKPVSASNGAHRATAESNSDAPRKPSR
jgi:uncharacterized protein (TIGR02147 family)